MKNVFQKFSYYVWKANTCKDLVFGFLIIFFAFEIQILNPKKTSSDAEVIFIMILDLEAPFILKISHICKDYFCGFSRPE